MGNVLCCEQSEKPLIARHKKDKNNQHLLPPQQIYYTNPEPKDEDFTFNDKLKLQSMGGKWEDRQIPSFPEKHDDNWQAIAQQMINDISKQNSEIEWNKPAIELVSLGSRNSTEVNPKMSLELIYSQDDERIYFGSKMLMGKQLEKILTVPWIRQSQHQSSTSPQRLTSENSSQIHQQQQACSFRNSQTNNSLQGGPMLVSNPTITRDTTREYQQTPSLFQNNSFQPASFSSHNNLVNNNNNSNLQNQRISRQPQQYQQQQQYQALSTRPQCLNVVKLEFKVNCNAEKLLKGLLFLKKFTSKIEQMEVIQGQQDSEFQVLHAVFGKYMQQVPRDLVVAHYSTEIGQNLHTCFFSINHPQVPEIQDVTRIQVIKAGHTFFEHYTTAADSPKKNPQNQKQNQQFQDNYADNSHNPNNNNNINSSTINSNTKTTNGNGAFGSMNLNIQVETKVRFYGEFICKSNSDENLAKMVFLTEFRDYIAMCKQIAVSYESAVSEQDAVDGEHEHEHEYDQDGVNKTHSEYINNNNDDNNNSHLPEQSQQ